MAQALVPLKDLVRAKTRLSGLLSPSERRALTQAMVEDVLSLLSAHPGVHAVNLVSDDPCAHLLAAQYGARHWTESELGCQGLNAVIASASDRLLASGDDPLLVLHADLPLLSSQDVSTVLSRQRDSGGLVLGADRHGRGTNLLCFDKSSVPEFCFGEDSCRRHLLSAQARRIPVQSVASPGIGLDVDQPADLARLLNSMQSAGRGRTVTLLRESDLATRIAVALSSIPTGSPSEYGVP